MHSHPMHIGLSHRGDYTYSPDPVLRDYVAFRRQARKWARIALQNKRDGLPWEESARNAHEALSFALLIIF